MPDISPRAALAFDLGLAAHRTGDFATALARFSEAHEAAPDWADAATALAHTHERLGHADEVYRIGFAALHMGTPSEALLTLLTGLLETYPPPQFLSADDFAPALSLDADVRLFAQATLRAMIHEAPLRDALAVAKDQGFDKAAAWALSPDGRPFIDNEIVRRALRAAPNTEPALELLLSAIERRIGSETSLRADPMIAAFAETLEAQCALNGSVWRDRAKDAAQEHQAAFHDATSRRVAQQYEDHPYPAWQRTTLPHPGTQLAELRALQRRYGFPETPDRPRVLIAGCGTGQQVVQMAAGLGPNARILACDLSAASLAYAQRKARDCGFGEIEFRQANILDLDLHADRFDIVACTGVLHHMENPLRGWRILTDLTKPGGAQYIALYSAIARAGLDDIRRRFPPNESLPIDERIRDFRRRVLETHAFDWAASGIAWTDFFTTAGCRDLLFHEHEGRYTIPRLARELDSLGIRFLDFVLLSSAAQGFAGARGDLAAWDAFECAHPDTFKRMYQFWCAKPG